MTKQKTTKHGGARPGAGRPKTGKETITVSWRVPADLAPKLREKISALIKKEIAKNIKLDSDQ